MKSCLLIILSTILVSCYHTKVKTTLEVTYENGQREEIVVDYTERSSSGIFFNNGCIYKFHEETKYDSPFKGCVVCGVRKFKIVKDERFEN